MQIDNHDGTYDISMLVTFSGLSSALAVLERSNCACVSFSRLSGALPFSITLNGMHVKGSPFNLSVIAGTQV